jgi:tetratricopeptide (TPR) repeat protein
MDVLKDTLEFYESFLAENPGDRKVQFELAKIYRRVGMMHQDFLRFTAAEWYRNKAIAILDELHAADPSNPEYRYELAVVLYQHAWIAYASSYTPRSIGLFEGLVKEFPENVSYREGLADALRSYVEFMFGTEFPGIGQKIDANNLRPLIEQAFQVARSPGVYKRYLGHSYNVSAGFAVCERRLDDAEADYRHAIRAFGEAVAERPTDGRTREHHMRSCRGLASFYEERGDEKQAEQWYRKAVELGEQLTHDFPSMRNFRDMENQIVGVFVAYLRKKDRIDDATELLVHLTPISARDFAERARLYTLLGQQELAKADYQEAIDRSQRATQSDSSNPEPYHALFDGLTGLGRRDEARALARDMPTHDVESLAVRDALYALFRYEQTPEDKAAWIALRSQLLTYFPADAVALTERAVAYVNAAEFENALRNLDTAVEIEPKLPAAHNARAQVYLEQKRYDKALDEMSELVRLRPGDPAVWNVRGVTYLYLKQYDKAAEDMTEAIRLDPMTAANFSNRAFAYLFLRRFDEALADCEDAIRIDASSGNAWQVRGLIHNELKQFKKAVEYFNEAIRLNPNDHRYLSGRGIAYRELGSYREAIDDYEESLATDNNYWHARINLAWLLATAGGDEFRDGKRALDLAQSAYDAGDFGSYGEAKFLGILAAAHAEVGDFENAVERCLKAIELAKDDNELLEELKKHLANYQAGRPWRIGGTATAPGKSKRTA